MIQNMNRNILVLIPIVLALLGFTIFSLTNEHSSSNLTLDPPKTVPYVDLSKYLGIWYQQALIPVYFENNCIKTIAQYSFNSNGTIKVNNTCERNGKRSGGIAHAYPDPQDKQHSNSKLKVKFPQTILAGNYWIVRLDQGYNYSVVSSPNYRDLWILYRQPHMPQELFESLYKDLQKDGFPVEKLKRTIQ